MTDRVSRDSHKWPTVLVDEVKGKPRTFEAYCCRSLYSTFTTSFYPYAFYNKRLQNALQRPTRPIQGNGSFNRKLLSIYEIGPWFKKSFRTFLNTLPGPVQDTPHYTSNITPVQYVIKQLWILKIIIPGRDLNDNSYNHRNNT